MALAVITLPRTTSEDLPVLFQFQQDAQANYLAAFTPKNPHDQAAYLEKYARLLTDPTVHMRTVRANGIIAGSIAKFMLGSDAELTYWIDRAWWGQGMATSALRAFLALEPSRPLCGRVAFDNYGSQRVLEKGGFVRIGQDRGFANARQTEIDEYIYQLSR